MKRWTRCKGTPLYHGMVPGVNRPVLGCYKDSDGNYRVAECIFDGERWLRCDNVPFASEITHWMDKPDMPQEYKSGQQIADEMFAEIDTLLHRATYVDADKHTRHNQHVYYSSLHSHLKPSAELIVSMVKYGKSDSEITVIFERNNPFEGELSGRYMTVITESIAYVRHIFQIGQEWEKEEENEQKSIVDAFAELRQNFGKYFKDIL